MLKLKKIVFILILTFLLIGLIVTAAEDILSTPYPPLKSEQDQFIPPFVPPPLNVTPEPVRPIDGATAT